MWLAKSAHALGQDRLGDALARHVVDLENSAEYVCREFSLENNEMLVRSQESTQNMLKAALIAATMGKEPAGAISNE